MDRKLTQAGWRLQLAVLILIWLAATAEGLSVCQGTPREELLTLYSVMMQYADKHAADG